MCHVFWKRILADVSYAVSCDCPVDLLSTCLLCDCQLIYAREALGGPYSIAF